MARMRRPKFSPPFSSHGNNHRLRASLWGIQNRGSSTLRRSGWAPGLFSLSLCGRMRTSWQRCCTSWHGAQAPAPPPPPLAMRPDPPSDAPPSPPAPPRPPVTVPAPVSVELPAAHTQHPIEDECHFTHARTAVDFLFRPNARGH